MPSLYPAKVLKPGKQSLDLPAFSVAPQGSAILGNWPLAADLVRSDHLDPLLMQPLIRGVTIVGSVTNQSFRSPLRKSTFQGHLDQLHFMRRSTSNGYGDRKTSAICHCHELCTLAPLGFSHPAPPFFAMTKVPSTKHSVKSSPPRSFTSFTSARSTLSKTPLRTHSWKRRWQVWYGGYLSGMSCQGAPVRRIQRMPFRISRSPTRGLPRPSARLATLGSKAFTTFHCSSLRSIGSPPFSGLSPVYHF
jgi:hypothetical protein